MLLPIDLFGLHDVLKVLYVMSYVNFCTSGQVCGWSVTIISVACLAFLFSQAQQQVADCAFRLVQERKHHKHRHHKHREADEETVPLADAEAGDSGEKKRRHRKKREEEGADAV